MSANSDSFPATSSALGAIDIITRKRDGKELSPTEIEYFIREYTSGAIPDYQASAWLMAVLLRGMTANESAALTNAMLHSGEVLDFSSIPFPKVDKHSTGGVGDKASLILAPLAAAGGLVVPMISGRGLGHTGGTLDKLEAIPGFDVHLSAAEFRRALERVGCAMIGQTAEVAPADRKLYALRDVTGTVESPFLICASIMSKKLAEGIDALVLDVKTGSGAFMKSMGDAEFLARIMVETGEQMGKRMAALITDMNQPLGNNVGNSLEVVEALDVLRDGGPADLRELCLELAGWMFYLGDVSHSPESGKSKAATILKSGAALEKFRTMVEVQGGDVQVVDNPERLPRARHVSDITSPASGFLTEIDCQAIGNASVILGAGRLKKEDAIDPAVGIVVDRKLGDQVTAGEPLCTIHYNQDAKAAQAALLLQKCFRVSQTAPAPKPLVHRVVSAGQ